MEQEMVCRHGGGMGWGGTANISGLVLEMGGG
jgi:hypothetical protein